MTKQNTPRTNNITPNNNITLPIGTMLSVQKFSKKLHFSQLFEKYKKKGREMVKLVEALVSYKLTDNFSTTKAGTWINQPEVLKQFSLNPFEQRTLFRCLEILGTNSEEIIYDLQDVLFEEYDFSSTDVVMDWTSLVLYGNKCPIAKYGYSRDHRPDKKQITLGFTQLASPINVPIGMTIKQGNTNDMSHFVSTYKQVQRKLKSGSLVTFDKGANSLKNTAQIVKDKMKYLTSKKLNTSDDLRIKKFKKSNAELIDPERSVYGIKYIKPSRIDYFFYSEKLKEEQLEAKKRKALLKLEEAKELQAALDKGKPLPKKYRIKNELIEIKYSYQTKLKELSEKDARRFIEKASINGREGFFCIVSTEDLTLKQALATYREKDSIEKIINSLKNEIEIKPLRVWTENSIRGALIIGFLAQLIISLLRYEHDELKQVATKFIKKSLMNLTVTVEFKSQGAKRYIYSNFDPINGLILAQKQGIT